MATVSSVSTNHQNSNEYCQCQNYRTEVEEYEGTVFTVPCCSIILFSSEGMKKNVSEFTPNFFSLFYNSCRSAVVL